MKARFIPVGRVYLKEMSPMGYRLLLFIIRRIDEGEISSDGEKNIRIHLNEFLLYLKTGKVNIEAGFEYRTFIDECYVAEAAVISGEGKGEKKQLFKLFRKLQFNAKSGTAVLTVNETVKDWMPVLVDSGIESFRLYDEKRQRELTPGKKAVYIKKEQKQKEKAVKTKHKKRGPSFVSKARTFFSKENLRKLLFEEDE